jgi:hypothetical protein
MNRPDPVIDTHDTTQLDETRIVLQKRRNETAATFVTRVREHAGPGSVVEPLFQWYRPRKDLPTLQDFFLVRWPGLDPRKLMVDQYDLAYELQDRTRSVSASPDPLVALGPASSHVREPDSVPDPAVISRANPVDNANWQLFAANVPPAWALAAGSGIVVGHIDTGIVPHILLGSRVDFANGYDFLEPGTRPVDPLPPSSLPGDTPGHGTFSSTTIAGGLDPGVPTASAGATFRPTTNFSGVAPAATILPVRATRNVVLGPLSSVSKAIEFLTSSNVDVISISLAGPAFSPHLHWALNNAISNHILVVAAAGQIAGGVLLPAALRQCLAVAGTKLGDTKGLSNDFAVMRDRLTLWTPSAKGPKVGIAAPAKDIRHGAPGAIDATGANTGMGGPSQGTTFATAMVAGVAALWLERHGRSALETLYRHRQSLQAVFKQVLARSAYRPHHWGPTWGPGALDAKGALDEPLPAPFPPALPSLASFLSQFNSYDAFQSFEDVFPDVDPAALRAALRRLFPANSEAEWRAAIERFGVELLNRLTADADAAARFVEAGVAEAANDAAAAAEQARQTAAALADQVSHRLRGRLGG